LSTVSGILTRVGIGKLGRLGLEPAVRYERSRPGELIHIDVEKLGRIQGRLWQASGWRRAQTQPSELGGRRRTPASTGGLGVRARLRRRRDTLGIRRGAQRREGHHAFLKRAVAFDASDSIKHIRTRPHRPQTNGKAERLIRTMLCGWAYAAIYRDSAQRTAALPGWLERYNWRRPHGALNHKPPGTKLNELDNLLGSYT
jgi:Integrase core domain